MTWAEAEAVLKPESVIAIPLGAAAKEHGLHLSLGNDLIIAEYLAEELCALSPVVLAPSINYSYYPAFVEYPGSISLSKETARAMIQEICLGLAAFGPRKFYIINTGISTLEPLSQAQELLKEKGLILSFSNFQQALAKLGPNFQEQPGGSHADELETSLMLAIAPHTVKMSLAAMDFHSEAKGPLSRKKIPGFSYSASGVWGDARLASKAKGLKIVQCLIETLVADVEALKRAD